MTLREPKDVILIDGQTQVSQRIASIATFNLLFYGQARSLRFNLFGSANDEVNGAKVFSAD